MNLQEQISRILKEDSNIPFVILRRVTPENIEEAFEFALDRMGYMMENPNSFIYKKKETTLRVFAKFVIDEMVTYLEQDYFTDDNRVYFEDDDFYYDKIRKPLLRYYGSRIKEKYYEIMNLQEQISNIQSMMGVINESELTFLRRKTIIKKLIDYGIEVILDNDDFCDYYAGSFLEEVQWLVTDKWKKLNLPEDLDIAIVHDWVENNFGDYIENEYYKYEDIMCNGDPYDVR
jgi:hypothetical protein